MEDFNKMYIRKVYENINDYKDINSVYTFLSEKNEYMIFKVCDTINMTEDIVAILKDDIANKFYTVKEFLEDSTFIGKSGYFKEMSEFEKELYKTFIILYANDKHLLAYDIFTENIFIMISTYNIKSFIPYKGQPDIIFNNLGFSRKR